MGTIAINRRLIFWLFDLFFDASPSVTRSLENYRDPRSLQFVTHGGQHARHFHKQRRQFGIELSKQQLEQRNQFALPVGQRLARCPGVR
jgi:hypothetical protein